MTLGEKITLYGELNADYKNKKSTLDDIKAEIDGLRMQILNEMAITGVKSAEDPEHKLLAVRKNTAPRVIIKDEKAAIRWLETQGMDVDFYVGLKKSHFDPIARTAYSKKDMEDPYGVEFEVDETVSISVQKGK